MPLPPTWAQCCWCPRRRRSVSSSCLLYRSSCCEQAFHRVLELLFHVRLRKEVCAFNKQSFHFVGNGIACRVEHAQIRPKLDGLVCNFTSAKERCFEMDIGKKCVNVSRGTEKRKRLVYVAGQECVVPPVLDHHLRYHAEKS